MTRKSLLSQMIWVVSWVTLGMAFTLGIPFFFSLEGMFQEKERERRRLAELQAVQFFKEGKGNPPFPMGWEKIGETPVLYGMSPHLFSYFSQREEAKTQWVEWSGWWGRVLEFPPYRVVVALPDRRHSLYTKVFFYILLTSFWVLLSAFAMMFVTHRLVLRPLEELLAANIGASQGWKEYFLIPESSIPENELGESMRQRNQLVKRLQEFQEKLEQQNLELQKRKEELERWNQELEKRVEQKTKELKKAMEKLAQAEKLAALGKIAFGIAHEVNNPLASIAGYVEAVIEELQQGGPKSEEERKLMIEDLQVVESQAYRLKELTRKLLDFSRSGEVQVETFPLYELVEETLSLLLAKYRGEFSVEVEIPKDLTLCTDRGKVQQILMNLLENGIYEVRQTKGKLKVSSYQWNHKIRIEVTDEGRGISKEIQDKVFEPFFSTKPVGQGSGLGLFVSYGLAKQLQGELSFVSEEGKGTSFFLDLPLKI